MASKIRKNDEIIVISGKNKGKRGIVKHVFSTGKIIVEGINIVKKHQKPIPNLNKPGGIIEKEASIATSNVAIFNKDTGKADGVKFTFDNGKKFRMFKSTNLIIK